jgi:hypothetical protein
MTESSKFTRREVIAGVTRHLREPRPSRLSVIGASQNLVIT